MTPLATPPLGKQPTRGQWRDWRSWPIAVKLNILLLLAASVLFGAMSLVLSQRMGRALESDGLATMERLAQVNVDMIDAYGHSLEANVNRLAQVFAAGFADGLTVDETTRVDVGGRQTPLLRHGRIQLNLDTTAVDRFQEITGSVATVFGRQGDDCIRVSTSLKTKNGQRALGSTLDRAHPAYAKVLAGQPYLGKAGLFGRDYMTKYLPFRNSAGRVSGLLFIGIEFTDGLKDLKDKIRATRFGAGQVYVIDAGEGSEQGTLVVHARDEGRNVLDARDPDGRRYIREMVELKTGTLQYGEKGEGNKPTRARIVVFKHYPEWNWIVASDNYLDDFSALSRTLRQQLAIAVGATVVLLLALAFASIRLWVSQPIAQALAAISRVAHGDLTVSIHVRRHDEVGRLMSAMQTMVATLTQIIGNVRTSADQLSGAAGQLAATAQSMSQSVSEQAASFEQTAESMTSISRSIEHNTANARVADGIAAQAASEAARSGEAVGTTVGDMKRIADKVGVIDEIAYQTNLLALNAAIEAARAGEHGRGFAVVAGEVRKLAERAQDAAHEIGELAGTSVAQAENAGAQLDAMVPTIGRTSELIQGIARMTSQQSTEVGQINSAMIQLNQATQQNAAASEELAATAEELGAQAENLQKTMTFFRLK